MAWPVCHDSISSEISRGTMYETQSAFVSAAAQRGMAASEVTFCIN